jgi:hypothetical protein
MESRHLVGEFESPALDDEKLHALPARTRSLA